MNLKKSLKNFLKKFIFCKLVNYLKYKLLRIFKFKILNYLSVTMDVVPKAGC